MSQRRLQFRPRVEALEDRLCPNGSTVVLPISAFLSQQGTTTVFTPPVPDQLGWANSVFDPGATSSDPTRFLSADYTGQAAQYLLQHGINLHTAITGSVTETAVGTSGLIEVSVNLEATNALTWVANIANVNPNAPGAVNTAPLELGYRAQDLVANPSLKPALSDAHLQITFREQAGAPLPDLAAAFNEGIAPAGFAPEMIDFQSWGAGTLDAATTVGTPGQTAFVNTSQVGDLVHPNLPGTLPDGFLQEPVNIVPVASTPASVTYLNGTLFITDLSNGNDSVRVTPAAGGGATVTSNLGGGTFAPVNAVVVSLGGGNANVQIGSLPGATVNVTALDGNDSVTVGDEGETVVNLGGGNNHVTTGNGSPTLIFLGGNGNNQVSVGAGQNNVYLAGGGNNHITAAGSGDFIEVLGNGNNHIQDTGTGDFVTLGGDGNNEVDNAGLGSFTDVLSGNGHNRIHGQFGTS